MSEQQPEIQEVKGLVDNVERAFNELKNDLDEKRNQDALDKEKLDKVTNDITKSLETIQKLEAKQEALETVLARMPTASDKEAKEKAIVQESKEALRQYMIEGTLPEGFKAGNDGVMIKSMQTAIDTDGGYLVLPEMSDMVVSRVFETSPLRRVANVMQTSRKSVEMLIDDDEAAANWTAEGSASSNTDTPNLGVKEITAHKMDAEPRATIEQLQDSYLDVEQWLTQHTADKFARTQNTAFFTGNGVGKPRGLTTYDAWASAGTYERDKIEQINSGSASTVTADGLIDLQNALKEPYQPNATFLMKRATYGTILKLAGNDQYFFGPTLLRDGQTTNPLLGKDVLFCDDMPAIGANNLAVAYGDFRVGYTIVDRVGIQVLRDPFSNKPFMTFYTTVRVGGDVTNFDSIKLHKIST